MAIYRAESGRRLVLIAAVAAVAGLVLGLAIGRLTAPGLGAQLDDLRTQLAPIRSSLEVVRTEYPKLVAGGADPGGTGAAMTRIETTLAAAKPALSGLDSAATEALERSVTGLRTAIDAKVPQDDLDVAAESVTAALDAVLPGAPVPSGD